MACAKRKFVLESAGQDQELLTQVVYVMREGRAWFETHHGCGPGNLVADPVEHAAADAGLG